MENAKALEAVSKYSGLPPAKITRILQMQQADVYNDAEYLSWVSGLDAGQLYETLPQARAAYEKQLPLFAKILREEYGLENTPMSAFTLGNWLVGFLQFPNQLSNLADIHRRIPVQAFREMLPEMIEMLNELPEGRTQWQQALAIMALPLLAERG